jgi:hypothetical protein
MIGSLLVTFEDINNTITEFYDVRIKRGGIDPNLIEDKQYISSNRL